jgi:hypothetical protein
MNKKLLTYLMLVAMGLLTGIALAACSDDDDDAALTGAEQVQQIITGIAPYMAYYEDFSGESFYLLAESQEEAVSICNDVTGTQWNGKATTLSLNDNYGTISIIPGTSEGFFAQITYDVKGLDVKTIKIVTENYYKNLDNRTN